MSETTRGGNLRQTTKGRSIRNNGKKIAQTNQKRIAIPDGNPNSNPSSNPSSLKTVIIV
jgi:hypothetical protein